MLKYAVIGTGAIGGYYGGMLAKAGKEVHFLFHSDYDFVKENGLQIDSINGNFKLKPVLAYKSTSDMPICDVVLIGLKSTNNALLKELLPPILGKGTIVILIQNGLGLEAELHKDFPDLNIAGGLAFICSQKTGKGHISHLDYGNLNLGNYSCSNISILEKVCDDFIQSGVNASMLELHTARWKKLVWNIPYNGLSVILNTETDTMMNQTPSRRLIYDLMLEVIHAANCSSCDIDDSFADDMMNMTDNMKSYSPSMKLDYDAKRPMEIKAIYSKPIKEALENGYIMSQVSVLEKQLLFIQSQYKLKMDN